MTIKVKNNLGYFGGDGPPVDVYPEGTHFEWDGDGDLSVRDDVDEIIAVHYRGTWASASVVAE